MLKNARKKTHCSCSLEGFTLIIAYIQAILYTLTLIGLLGAIIYLKQAIHEEQQLKIHASLSFLTILRDQFMSLGYHVLDLLTCVSFTIVFLVHLTFDVLLILGIQSRKTVLIMVYFVFGFIVNAGGIIASVMLFILGYYKIALPWGALFAAYTVVLTLVWLTYRRIETSDGKPVNEIPETVDDCHPQSTSVIGDLSHWMWGPGSKKNTSATKY